MLKIGTSKMGSVVDCPRCHKPVIVPPQSVPQAEQLYQILKDKRRSERTTSSPAETSTEINTVSEPTMPESVWDELGSNGDETNLNQWIDELWKTRPADPQESFPPLFPAPPLIPDSVSDAEFALFALQKKHRLTLTLLYVSAAVAFSVGIVFGISLYAFFAQPTQSFQHAAGEDVDTSEVMGTLYYFNDNGERRPDVDAVIICLPKDRIGKQPLSCRGLRPGDTVNGDTVQLIQEMGGMYKKADAYGSFTLQYRKEVPYFVILISANQMRTGGEMRPGVLQELRQYFSDPELFRENYFTTRSLGGDVFEHTFESVD